MMGLNRLDGLGLDVKLSLPTPLDWIEKRKEEEHFGWHSVWIGMVLPELGGR